MIVRIGVGYAMGSGGAVIRDELSVEDRACLKSIFVLLVDDEAEVRLHLGEFLGRFVGRLLVAADGEEGLLLWERERPDVVVTDILMPGLDGLAMAQVIRSRDREVPLIVISAFNDEEYLLRSIEVGVDGYVRKPAPPHGILRAVLRVTRPVLARRRLAQVQAYSRFVLDLNPNLIMVVAAAKVVHLNSAFLAFLGLPELPREGEGIEVGGLLTAADGSALGLGEEPEWVDRLLAYLERDPIIYLRDPRRMERLPTPFALSLNTAPDGRTHVFSFTDVTRLEKQLRELKERAFTDPLTGACNQAKARGQLEAEVKRARRHRRPLSLVYFDLDHFRQINHRVGHERGDALLLELVALVIDGIRTSDLLARWGGGEFLVILPETPVENAVLAARKLREMIRGRDFAGVGPITASFGVAGLLPGGAAAELFAEAELHLLRAKEQGRDRVAFAGDEASRGVVEGGA
ncbi:MAG: diguanylate cyclase [Magnetococcales bacterium]|nr:diguanylate cyclase [Magnetococcales bacterium]